MKKVIFAVFLAFSSLTIGITTTKQPKFATAAQEHQKLEERKAVRKIADKKAEFVVLHDRH